MRAAFSFASPRTKVHSRASWLTTLADEYDLWLISSVTVQPNVLGIINYPVRLAILRRRRCNVPKDSVFVVCLFFCFVFVFASSIFSRCLTAVAHCASRGPEGSCRCEGTCWAAMSYRNRKGRAGRVRV